jgi:hypothetical protein
MPSGKVSGGQHALIITVHKLMLAAVALMGAVHET